jgi:hypothetical protein
MVDAIIIAIADIIIVVQNHSFRHSDLNKNIKKIYFLEKKKKK